MARRRYEPAMVRRLPDTGRCMTREEAEAILAGEAAQSLIGNWAELVVITRAKSYRGKCQWATRRRGGVIRLSLVWATSRAQFILTLCHEVAHHKRGRGRQPHGYQWKHKFAETLIEAVGLGLLTEEERSAARRIIFEGKLGDGLDTAGPWNLIAQEA